MTATHRKRLTKMEADERRRRFARAYFHSGLNARKAFETVGMKVGKTASAVTSSLGRMLNEPVVADEFAALVAAARQIEGVRAVETAKLFAEIAESDVFDYFTQGDDGVLAIRADIHDMTKAQRRAVKKIKVTKSTRRVGKGDDVEEYVTVNTEVELWDKIQALAALTKIQGLTNDDGGMEALARTLAERLNLYQKRAGRVFDGAYEEVLSD